MSGGPLVTAVVPTRNRPQLVLRAVQSAMMQTYANLEVVVVVDGPDPETVAMLVSLREPRLRVVPLEANVGVAEARNIGAREARGEWIGLLDDDDEWLPEKIARQLALLVSPHTNFVACRCEETERGVRRTLPQRFPMEGENWSEYICCSNNLFLPSGWLVRRDLMIAEPFELGVQLCEDMFWVLRVRCANVIMPQFTEDVLFRSHGAHGQAQRLRGSTNWKGIFQWVDTHRGELLTRKAFSYFLIRFCLPRAKRSRTAANDSLFVLSAAFSRGKCDLPWWVLATAHVCLSPAGRVWVRQMYQSARTGCRQQPLGMSVPETAQPPAPECIRK